MFRKIRIPEALKIHNEDNKGEAPKNITFLAKNIKYKDKKFGYLKDRLSAYISGRAECPNEVLAEIHRITGISVGYLIRAHDNPHCK